MSDERADDQDLLLSEHIPNIAKATRTAIASIQQRNPGFVRPVEVIAPPNEPGDIVHPVFNHIMHCDLAIADISDLSPNVFYELSLLHANGVPVILLTQNKKNAFYLLQMNMLNVENFEVGTLTEALDPVTIGEDAGQLEKVLLTPREFQALNPITKHFNGVHLINVAAATGLATGQFFNFLQYVLKPGGVFRHPPIIDDKPRRFQGIILVRPSGVEAVDDDIADLESTFGEPVMFKGEPVLDKEKRPKIELPDFKFLDERHPRGGYFVRYVKDWLLDYPTPINSLRVSRQYLDMIDYVKTESPTLKRGPITEEQANFEKRLIDIYFDTLERLASSPENDAQWGKVRVLTAAQIIEELGD